VSLITEKKSIFRKIIKTQTNSQIVNRIPRNHGLVTGAHGSEAPGRPIKQLAPAPLGETPLRSRGTAPYQRNSVSLEGWTPPQERLRLARGLDATSGRTPPRSRLSRVRRSRTHSPDWSIKCSDTTRAPGSRVNPRHAVPLIRLGIISRRCFANPPGEAIPSTVRHCAVRPVSAL
jgi:hypothetical protein